MNYKVVENILSTIYQFAYDNKIIVVFLWIAVMFFLLRKCIALGITLYIFEVKKLKIELKIEVKQALNIEL